MKKLNITHNDLGSFAISQSDYYGNNLVIQDMNTPEHLVKFQINDTRPLYLSPMQVKNLLPYLQHFTDTGKLASEPENIFTNE